jgi:hypothetical protein
MEILTDIRFWVGFMLLPTVCGIVYAIWWVRKVHHWVFDVLIHKNDRWDEAHWNIKEHLKGK